MSRVAIIPARGGSKRIPRKNIKPFLGRPILSYSIEAALLSGCFDEVMVSTEDLEIAEVARRYGAEVPFLRSKKDSNDFAPLGDVIRSVLETYQSQGRPFDVACCILATAPFITPERLREGLTRLEASTADALVGVVPFDYPIQRALRIRNGREEMFWPENHDQRSNDLETAYHDSGQFYWLKTQPYLDGDGKLLLAHCLAMELPALEVQDIDSPDDWALAELKYRFLHPE